MGDVLGLLAFGGMCVAIFFACRRIKSGHASAVASAHASGVAEGKATVLAHIGNRAVVNLQLGHRFGGSPGLDYDDLDDVVATYGGEHPGLGGADPRLALGVPVGRHPHGADGDVRQERVDALALMDSDEALRVVRGRGPGG